MVYHGFTRKALALAESPAIHHLKMRLVVHECSNKNFSIVADRVAMKDLLNTVEVHFDLFSKEDRFPDNGLYVFLDLADWNKKWQDLQSSLDYKPGNKDPKKFPNSQVPDSKMEEHQNWDFNDANQVFRNTLRAMSVQLANLEGVIDRYDFETSYHLEWLSEDTISDLLENKSIKLRLRAFRIDNNNFENMAWPGIGASMTLLQAGNLPLEDVDYLVIWGDRSLAERPRLILDVKTGRVDSSVSVITGD